MGRHAFNLYPSCTSHRQNYLPLFRCLLVSQGLTWPGFSRDHKCPMGGRLSSSQRMLAFVYWEAEASISSQEPFVGNSSRYICERGLGKICGSDIMAHGLLSLICLRLGILLSVHSAHDTDHCSFHWQRRKPGHGRLDHLLRSSARKRLSQDLTSEMSAELCLPLSGLGNTNWSVFNWAISPTQEEFFLPSFLAYFLLTYFLFWHFLRL